MKTVLRIIFAVLLLAAGLFVHEYSVEFYLAAYLLAGYDVLLEALEGIKEHEIFDECFLMAVATIGALFLHEYSEACAVMILYQTGELFQDYASDKSRDTITKLLDLRPDYANLEDGNRIDPASVKAGSIIVVKPGERIPIDGVILDGHSALDTSALTGESLPREVVAGQEVMSGCVNLSGVVHVRTTKEFGDSAASRILELVENASSRKAKTENFITRFARVYTPAVCVCAVLLAVIPPLVDHEKCTVWLYRALTFLVISCPCALVISVPLTFFAAIGGAGKAGILVKGSNFLEALAKITCAVFDKTGTLTRGVFEVAAVCPEVLDETELLHLAAHVERYSSQKNLRAMEYEHELTERLSAPGTRS